MQVLAHFLLVTVSLYVTHSTALQCYTCQKTIKTVDRFTKEETETLQCSEDPEDWTVETCSDEREFCSKEKSVISYSNVKYDRGCAIPKGKYSKNINNKLSIQTVPI